jgi:hypothetical protein
MIYINAPETEADLLTIQPGHWREKCHEMMLAG